MSQIRIDLNTVPNKDGSCDPFITIESNWCKEGMFSLRWQPTPEELRELAERIEAHTRTPD